MILHKQFCPSYYFSLCKQTPMIKGEKIFYLVFIEMQMYGPKQGSNFLEARFICNNINTNLNKNFHTQLLSLFQTVIFIFFHFCEK